MADARAEAVVAVVLMACLGFWASLRTSTTVALPPRVPCAKAEWWMVDALPGIGLGRGEAALEAVRAGRFEDLPSSARTRAEEVFIR